jgi:hypothetical protein
MKHPLGFGFSMLFVGVLCSLGGCSLLTENYGSYDFSPRECVAQANNNCNGAGNAALNGSQPCESKAQPDDWAKLLLGYSFELVGEKVQPRQKG